MGKTDTLRILSLIVIESKPKVNECHVEIIHGDGNPTVDKEKVCNVNMQIENVGHTQLYHWLCSAMLLDVNMIEIDHIEHKQLYH